MTLQYPNERVGAAVHPIADVGFASPSAEPGVRRKRRDQRSRFGVIYNPRATANVGKAPLRAIDTPCAVPTTQPELVDALRDFARREVSTIAVSGGDGTVRDVLTALPYAYARQPAPSIAILAAGRTDLIAGDIGAMGRDDELARLLAASKDGSLRSVTRPVVRVNRAVDSEGRLRTLRGMLLGAAGFAYATKLGQGEVHASGASHSRAVAITIATVLKRILLEGDPDGLRTGHCISVRADGRADEAGPNARRSIFLATGLRGGIVVGRSPFWGAVSHDQLRYLDVPAPTRGVARAFAALLVRKPWLAGPGWNTGIARSIELEIDSPIVVDGELFEPLPGDVMRITADGPTVFVAP